MTTTNVKVLVSYRLEQARESLDAAQVLLDQGLTRPSVNRSYYAMFYSVLALLATRKQETSKHSGAISLFDKEFVKTGAFKKELSRRLHNAFDLRQRSDYAAQIQVSDREAGQVLEEAQKFVDEVKAHLVEHGFL
ncbi:MAG: HEPN domain-containing protein [Deltaproteobacteria bacterium]|nr:HEPN domain-containing protein [Deltaproteobacteria bacterium]